MKTSATISSERVTFPRDDDILCGKSKTCVNHVGSRRYREFLDTYRERYAAATTKYQKMVITKEIYQTLKDRQCRFLRFNKSRGIWEEIGPAVARDKIGHALRFNASRAAMAAEASASALPNRDGSSEANASELQRRPDPEGYATGGRAASLPPAPAEGEYPGSPRRASWPIIDISTARVDHNNLEDNTTDRNTSTDGGMAAGHVQEYYPPEHQDGHLPTYEDSKMPIGRPDPEAQSRVSRPSTSTSSAFRPIEVAHSHEGQYVPRPTNGGRVHAQSQRDGARVSNVPQRSRESSQGDHDSRVLLSSHLQTQNQLDRGMSRARPAASFPYYSEIDTDNLPVGRPPTSPLVSTKGRQAPPRSQQTASKGHGNAAYAHGEMAYMMQEPIMEWDRKEVEGDPSFDSSPNPDEFVGGDKKLRNM